MFMGPCLIVLRIHKCLVRVHAGYTERALSKMDELFLTLVKLRFGLPLHHVANLFNISSSTVSRVFTSWINLLYFVLRIYQFLVAETCNSRNNARLL